MSRNVYRSYEILCELDIVGRVKEKKKNVKLFHLEEEFKKNPIHILHHEF